jgi:hypothetical protein
MTHAALPGVCAARIGEYPVMAGHACLSRRPALCPWAARAFAPGLAVTAQNPSPSSSGYLASEHAT